MILATSDACIPGYRKIAEACHEFDCAVFGQLFHPGREILQAPNGTAPVAYSASAAPNERFHIMPRALPKNLIREIVAGYGSAATRLISAGLDGVEIVASHGYLPDQFLNPRINRREDEYGGDFEGRLRFLRECIAEIRCNIGDGALGLRICADSKDPQGLERRDVVEICAALDRDGLLDYYSIAAGSSAGLRASIHIAPPMNSFDPGYVAEGSRAIRDVVSKPVIVTGRVNRAGIAEEILARGDADLCGMTRAMICDPELAKKIRGGRSEEIRECIGCNQACIGHLHLGCSISCIQYPESGRELVYVESGHGQSRPASSAKSVMVIGGGPGGMKAAAVAAARGHAVSLYERAECLGGQALLAQKLPGRGDFGGLIENLLREVRAAGVEVHTRVEVDLERIEAAAPDVLILASGARPRIPEIPGIDLPHVLSSWDVLGEGTRTGNSVVVADWRCDWIGLGLAELLARDGCRVRLCVNGMMPGQTIQQYVRDPWIGILHELDVEMIPLLRLSGVDEDTVYFEHTLSGRPVIYEQVDSLVFSLGHEADNTLERQLGDYSGRVIPIGDCLAPRTAEEAILEGLQVTHEL
jgi:2,4-dienoyl-CoA reductase-like NADH-dependent reductase (Old Yellow Enzyme family)